MKPLLFLTGIVLLSLSCSSSNFNLQSKGISMLTAPQKGCKKKIQQKQCYGLYGSISSNNFLTKWLFSCEDWKETKNIFLTGKAYYFTEESTGGDIWISLPVGFFSSISRRTRTLYECNSKQISVSSSEMDRLKKENEKMKEALSGLSNEYYQISSTGEVTKLNEAKFIIDKGEKFLQYTDESGKKVTTRLTEKKIFQKIK